MGVRLPSGVGLKMQGRLSRDPSCWRLELVMTHPGGLSGLQSSVVNWRLQVQLNTKCKFLDPSVYTDVSLGTGY